MSELDAVKIVAALSTATDADEKLKLALDLAAVEPEEAREIISVLDPTCVDTQECVFIKLGETTFPVNVAFQIFPADFVRGFTNPKIVINVDPLNLLSEVTFTGTRASNSAPHPYSLLRPFLPRSTVYKKCDEFINVEPTPAPEFRLRNPVIRARTYEVYKLSASRSIAEKEYLRRALTFAIFFIDGARLPDFDDPHWEFYILARGQDFAGYCSVYNQTRFTTSAEFSEHEAKVSKRIVHLLTFPPAESRSANVAFLVALYMLFKSDPTVSRVVYEDPEEYTSFRDRAQLEYVVHVDSDQTKDFQTLETKNLSSLATEYKLDIPQIRRCCELLALQNSPNPLQPSLKLSRFILEGIWEAHYMDIRDLSQEDQAEKCQQMYEDVLDEHYKTLEIVPENELETAREESDGVPPAKRVCGDTVN